MQNKKIFIIATEVSADNLGAKIIESMPEIKFVGIGGENMEKKGLNSLFPISDLSVMGIFEVLLKIKTLKKRILDTVKSIEIEKPDLVLTIDAPSFAKEIIKRVKLKNKNLKFFHVVAPQVWAWGEKRASKYAKLFDRLYCFFDFEKKYFEKYGLKTISVGHPIAEKLKQRNENKTDKNIITFIPGSRISEVKKLLPVFRKLSKKLKDKNIMIPTVETTKNYIEKYISNWENKPELINSKDRYKLYDKTYIAIAASGTVSTELAILGVPTIIIYKMNFITEFLAKLLLKVKYVSLINILMNKEIYPELLGKKATDENILKKIEKLSEKSVRSKLLKELSQAKNIWKKDIKASEIIADDIRSQLEL